MMAEFSEASFDFLGYTFRCRKSWNRKQGQCFTNFLPAISRKSVKKLHEKMKEWKLHSLCRCFLAMAMTERVHHCSSGLSKTFASWLETPTGSSRDWELSARLVQLLQQVWQDWVCQSYEPPEHGACLLGTQEIQALPSQAHCQGSHLAARDSEQRPQSILSLAERSDLGCQVCYRWCTKIQQPLT